MSNSIIVLLLLFYSSFISCMGSEEIPYRMIGTIKVDQYIMVHDISQAIIMGSLGAVAIVVIFKIVEEIIIPFIQEKYNYIKNKLRDRKRRKTEHYLNKKIMI